MNKKITYIQTIILGFSILLIPIIGAAQTAVTIDFQTQKFLNDASTLDRTKYFNIHIAASQNYSDKDMSDLKDWGVTMGRSFWGPFGRYKEYINTNNDYPAEELIQEESSREINYLKTQHYYKYITPQLIITDHPDAMVDMDMNTENAGKFAANHFYHGYEEDKRPIYYEPVNEPFVHAHEPVFTEDGKYSADEVRIKTAEYFRDIGKAFDEKGLTTNVVGYVSAWPQMELWDFGHWESRMKMFMDIAGDYMDGISIHLYDGINVTGQDTERSGSNSVATLDLINTYSFIKWDSLKPLVISEYGGIPNGYDETYSDIKSIQSVRSINHLIFQLLDIQDKLMISVPFITGKSPWYYQDNDFEPYKADLWKPVKSSVINNEIKEYEYTAKRRFYDLWNKVNGNRVQCTTSNQDIFAQTFVDNNAAYICLNNIDAINQEVSLQFLTSVGNINSVNKRSLKIYVNAPVIYEDLDLNTLPESITLEPHETVVLTLGLERPIVFNKKAIRKEYYSKTYLQPIKANTPLNFTFNTVDINAEEGEARLRMSIGRKHNVSKKPIVKVNGKEVKILDNWKGYDQTDKDDFFGALEIPIPHAILEEKNEVSITFPDNGGTISSVILSVNNFYDLGNRLPFNVDPFTLPGKIEAEDFDLGGHGLAYFTFDNNNNYNQYRFNEGVDIKSTEENKYTIELDENEWTSYSISVDQPVNYTLRVNGAAITDSAKISVTVDNEILNTPFKLSSNENKDYEFQVELGIGEYPIHVIAEQGKAEIDYIGFIDEELFYEDILFTPNNTTLFDVNDENIFEIEYDVSKERDIIVEAWGDIFLLGKSRISVEKGNDKVLVPITTFLDSIDYQNIEVTAKIVQHNSLNNMVFASTVLEVQEETPEEPPLALEDELTNKKKLLVFPNPTSNNQKLTLRGESNIYKVETLDIQGNVIDTFMYKTPQKQVTARLSNNYTAGIYLVRVYGISHYAVSKILIK
ncbi:T9SS type A sorting domain-containing protein [Flammeovirga pectinis]|uniref:T9SS type A sorting domain-containing protein n=1 Tax=Flammeovirga pectinis TaxID=2494373 RepID=A0A3S9P719_9BACT|nr:T9SS type A sorting domain-containing protein [Flammeovirga pectinis]AZQ63988.1 T9SS type A sorting domain-containing protein [Flammeovirga pectinis]